MAKLLRITCTVQLQKETRFPFFFLIEPCMNKEFLWIWFFQRDLGEHTLHFKIDWDTCRCGNKGPCEAAAMVLARSPRLVKHRAVEVPEFIWTQDKAEAFPKKPHGDDLLHAPKCGASCLSLYHQAAEAIASHLSIKYNKKENPRHLNSFHF